MNTEYDVLLLSAGLGTRLRPLTLSLPKPLIRVGGQPLIEYHLTRLAAAGVRRVIVNLHYLPEKIVEALGDGARFGLEIVYSRENPILDTGGAIKQIERELRHSTLLTMNSDTIIGDDFSIPQFVSSHQESAAAISLLVRPLRDGESFSPLGVSRDGRLMRFLGHDYATSTAPLDEMMFTGVALLDRSVLALMPGAGSVFSISKEIWPLVLERGLSIRCVSYNGYWNDVGTLERLEGAERDFSLGRFGGISR